MDRIILFVPLQRTGSFASLSLIIKHGLGLRIHRHNTLFCCEFTLSGLFLATEKEKNAENCVRQDLNQGRLEIA